MRILHKAAECIGCGVCADIASHYFEMNEDGLAQLLASTREDVFNCAEANPADVQSLKRAEAECPVDIIRLG
jgi:ferredoxin